ncbi:craniofacial development protein 2-like [Anoplophora glabripennis]|uniref:craniofacial development protein 2-like n=1 Tax=Anoplophora glabripennis TaxID=217634 RepID=UPI000C77F8DD|nr:craniofacial development protein 2-like [Anoplophora glabripennis]
METDYELRSKKEKEKVGNYGKFEKQNGDIEVKKNVKNKKDGKIYVATWNVRGTYTEGALIRLTQIMSNYAIDIVAIQETKQKGNFTQEIGNYIYFNSGADDRIFGTGFLVTKKLKSEIVEFLPISNRLCKLRIRSKYRKISIINVHCPTEEKEEEEKEEFYERIEGVYNKIPRYDVKMVIGDFHAKIGKEEIYKPIIGSHSKHNQSNENGKKLIEFATEKDLWIVTTFFQHKNIHKGTWTSPNGKTMQEVIEGQIWIQITC